MAVLIKLISFRIVMCYLNNCDYKFTVHANNYSAHSCEDAPEVKNADRNITATEVIYTCKPNHTFCDGETQKTYSCLCAQTAVMKSCERKLAFSFSLEED